MERERHIQKPRFQPQGDASSSGVKGVALSDNRPHKVAKTGVFVARIRLQAKAWRPTQARTLLMLRMNSMDPGARPNCRDPSSLTGSSKACEPSRGLLLRGTAPGPPPCSNIDCPGGRLVWRHGPAWVGMDRYRHPASS